MHSFRPALVSVLAFSSLLGSFIPTAAAAQDTAAVSTDPTGAHIELRHNQYWQETRRPNGAAPEACLRKWFPFEEILPGDDSWTTPTPGTVDPRPAAEYQPYEVYCGDTFIATVWLRAEQFGVDPIAIAERLVIDLPYPPARLGTNPQTRGLTGLETWFWVDGYTGAPITDVITEFGMRVEVNATPTSVSWDFGDGTHAKGLGLGSGPPTRSGVVHTFETRARPTFSVRALIMLSVRWRLNGGAWQDLDPVVRTAVRPYPVVESRAALVSDG